MPEGGESPPPETLSGRQQRDPPASGKGIDNAENKGENKGKDMKSELDVSGLVSWTVCSNGADRRCA